MIKKLNPWQRLFGMFVVVFLASTLAVIAAAWPKPETGIVADLRSPQCQQWRELPDGVFPDTYPEATKPCYSIRLFLLEKHVTLRTEDAYDRYLTRAGGRNALTFLAIWVGFSAAVYILGWSTSKLVNSALLRRSERKPG